MGNSNNLKQYDGEAGGDDGFSAAFSADRTIKGTQVVWNDAQHWRDRDGLKPPDELLAVGTDNIVQRWKGGLPEVIRNKPLPDPDVLNAAIPVDEWEVGLDGQKRPPWADTAVVYFIDPLTGAFFTFVSSTTGARIGVDHLKESVTGMRMLRGDRVLPLIKLGERPMKTRFGVKSRPHFEIVSWKEAGAPILEEEAPKAALPLASELEAEPGQTAAPALQSEPAKVKRKTTTLERMGNVKSVSPGEAVNDKIPW
jgi:hypothetical protein